MKTSTFNSKVTEAESKIKDADIIAKNAVTKANTIRSDLTDYAKKADVATIKNDYVSNASLTSQLNNLKSQHIAIEVIVSCIEVNDILALKNELEKKECAISENEIGIIFNRGFFYYLQQNNLVYECKVDSFVFDDKKISNWKVNRRS